LLISVNADSYLLKSSSALGGATATAGWVAGPADATEGLVVGAAAVKIGDGAVVGVLVTIVLKVAPGDAAADEGEEL
jgi:hypothetical protein